jgi:hypothetical protein
MAQRKHVAGRDGAVYRSIYDCDAWDKASDGFTRQVRASPLLEVIDRLLDTRQLQRVPADAATVEGLLDSARRHVATGRTATTNDMSDHTTRPEGKDTTAAQRHETYTPAERLRQKYLSAWTTGTH